jgi:hypothetical protein
MGWRRCQRRSWKIRAKRERERKIKSKRERERERERKREGKERGERHRWKLRRKFWFKLFNRYEWMKRFVKWIIQINWKNKLKCRYI